jgi:hypothetical protein
VGVKISGYSVEVKGYTIKFVPEILDLDGDFAKRSTPQDDSRFNINKID